MILDFSKQFTLEKGSHRQHTPPPVRHEYSTRPLRPSRPRLRHPKSRPVSPLDRNGYSYAPFIIAKSKVACGLCFHQLGGHVDLPWLICKYDVIRKTGSS